MDYKDSIEKESQNSFQGVKYRLADSWFSNIPVEDFKNKPIKYLEIGVFYGANLFSVCDSYAQHPDSKVYGIDPWEEYEQYDEYIGEQKNIYQTFLSNLNSRVDKNKIEIRRGFSYREIPKLEDSFFDIIYIDGNHCSDYVLEDAVISFRKLKPGGYMIFDDYLWASTQKGVNAFVFTYDQRLKIINLFNHQLVIQKIC